MQNNNKIWQSLKDKLNYEAEYNNNNINFIG